MGSRRRNDRRTFGFVRAKASPGSRLPYGGALTGWTVQGTHAYFGTYSVIDKNKTLVFHVEGNTFPNQEGIDTERLISFKGDEFTWITPKPSVGGKSEAIWKRVN
jgi:hypothetical protein